MFVIINIFKKYKIKTLVLPINVFFFCFVYHVYKIIHAICSLTYTFGKHNFSLYKFGNEIKVVEITEVLTKIFKKIPKTKLVSDGV